MGVGALALVALWLQHLLYQMSASKSYQICLAPAGKLPIGSLVTGQPYKPPGKPANAATAALSGFCHSVG